MLIVYMRLVQWSPGALCREVDNLLGIGEGKTSSGCGSTHPTYGNMNTGFSPDDTAVRVYSRAYNEKRVCYIFIRIRPAGIDIFGGVHYCRLWFDCNTFWADL